ncbi:Cysteine-rich repeat secretory protein 38 [Platanthera zijinensis]|uniref:Cysteine-rich repeat secretory protein 38 n=1 Tax=Platanthera zijinensis TaxID=2320716 RepID=A0AAP0AXX9_9ASPA
MAASSSQLLFFFLLLLPLAINGADFITLKCEANFTGNAILQGNINTLLLDLEAKTSARGFANSSRGAGNDTVYGISECREDATAEKCAACMAEAVLQAYTSCPNSAESYVWHHSCFLRYANREFFGQADSGRVGAWSSTVKAADPPTFARAVVELLDVVGIEASYGEYRKFGWGELDTGRSYHVPKLYGMAECTWDLRQQACINCLLDAYKLFREDCGDRVGCVVMTKSCSLRFDVDAFLFLNGRSSPASSVTAGHL